MNHPRPSFSFRWAGAIAFSAPLVMLCTQALAQPRAAFAAELTRWSFDPVRQQLELEVPEGTSPQYFLLAQPPRIVVDLPGTVMGSVPEIQTYPGQVQSIRIGQFQPTLTRIVIELVPDAVFAPGHLQVEAVDGAAADTTQAAVWHIRPLLVGNGSATTDGADMDAPMAPPIESTPDIAVPAEAPIESEALATEALATEALAAEALAEPELELELEEPPAEPVAPAEPEIETPIASEPSVREPADGFPDSTRDPNPANELSFAVLPPLEPGALELPIELLEQAPSMPEEPELEPQSASTVAIAPDSTPAPAAPAPAAPAPAITPEPDTLNTASPEPFLEPSLEPTPESSEPLNPAPSAPLGNDEPSTPSSLPLPPNTGADTPVDVPIIAFGQQVTPSPAPFLPAGTILVLRYPRDRALALQRNTAQQEVLVTTVAVRDSAGNIVLPIGSQVIGRAERGERESVRFVAQALVIGDRTVVVNRTAIELPNTTALRPNRIIPLRLGEAIRW